MHTTSEAANGLELLCQHAAAAPEVLAGEPPHLAFGEAELAFIDDFSSEIIGSRRSRAYPEVVALGFWMRRANVARIKASFEAAHPRNLFVGRGLVLHIAPSNVDTMFAYSLVLSLLAGNTNIVRVSTKLSDQLERVIEVLDVVLERHPSVAKRLLVVRYGHDDSVTAHLSGLCHARVVWGGDETVRRIRAIALPSHALELAFPAKFSVAVLDAPAWNAHSAKSETAKAFCNDAFAFNQQACSSPKLVYWRGHAQDVADAQATFWPAVETHLVTMPAFVLDAAGAMERFVAACSAAIDASVPIVKCDARSHGFIRLQVASLDDLVRATNTGNGLFFEYSAPDLERLFAWFDDADQTVGSFGISAERWEVALRTHAPRGICRVVRLGTALEFASVWDGHDVIRSLLREIVVAV